MTRNKSITTAAIVIAAVFATAATGILMWSASTKPTQPPNVVLIIIDTLPTDRLGGYGFSRDTSPELDDLARRGARFGVDCLSGSRPYRLVLRCMENRAR